MKQSANSIKPHGYWSFRIPSWNLILIGILAITITSFLLIFEYIVNKGSLGAPLDDVYIHFQFSKNLAEGKGFAFNANEPTPGSTSPAWTLLITLPYLLIKNHLLIAKTFSVIFYILTGTVTYFLGKEILKSRKWAFMASIFTLLTGRFAWSALSGMEVSLFTFLLSLALFLHLKNKSRFLIAGVLGIASTVRPEGYLITIFYFLILLIKSISSFQSSRSSQSKLLSRFIVTGIKDLLVPGIIYMAIIAPYLIFSFKTTGSFLPNTFTAQSIASTTLFFKVKMAILYILRYFYLVFIDNPFIALALPFGLYYIVKSAIRGRGEYRFLALVAIGFPIIASLAAPNLRHHGRYTIPFIPIYTIIALEGFKQYYSNPLSDFSVRRFACRTRMFLMAIASLIIVLVFDKVLTVLNVDSKITFFLIITTYILFNIGVGAIANKFLPNKLIKNNPQLFIYIFAIILQLILLFNWASTYAWNVKNINDMHVTLGKWINENTPMDSVIALNDIGAITYYSQREIIDLVGLVSPDVLEVTDGLSKEEREAPLWQYLKEKQPDYIIILPCWYPEISKKEELKEMKRIRLDKYLIIDCEMVVYEWNESEQSFNEIKLMFE
ncbi:hypothetical protein JW766_00260 [Candidatus Dojkabacteria bacterium]|nr:hypothetical protein [Candidatus Dojkabacteria bacterium]